MYTSHPLYCEDISLIANLDLPWEQLVGSSVLITGATGMIGSVLVDAIMEMNKTRDLNCRVIALGRNQVNADIRFKQHLASGLFSFVCHDINTPLPELSYKVDFIFHLASNTHPIAYSTDPVGTITANIIGLQHLLEFAIQTHVRRVLFASSVEIYGENRNDVETFDEDYCGYINCNTLRAGYPESKRCGEALCQAYISQHQLDIVIPRLPRTYGASMRTNDSKALSQFLLKAKKRENIVLKSTGTQFFSYAHVADVVAAMLTILLKGQGGEAYNIANSESDITLKELATTIAATVGTQVVFDLPTLQESAGYSKATKARLNGEKLTALGWVPFYNIKTGLKRTLDILCAEDFY